MVASGRQVVDVTIVLEPLEGNPQLEDDQPGLPPKDTRSTTQLPVGTTTHRVTSWMGRPSLVS